HLTSLFPPDPAAPRPSTRAPAPHKCPIDVRITSSSSFGAVTFHRSPARLPVDLMLSRPKSTISKSSIGKTARGFATLLLAATVAVSGSVTAFAQGVPVVRDAEIEALVRDYARPIFQAAG